MSNINKPKFSLGAPKAKMTEGEAALKKLEEVQDWAIEEKLGQFEASAAPSSKAAPWRDVAGYTREETDELSHRLSLDIPLELYLRMKWLGLLSRKNRRAGNKMTITDITIAALDKHTKDLIKKTGDFDL